MKNLKLKALAKKVSYRKRHLTLTSKDQVRCRKLTNLFLALAAKRKMEGTLNQEADNVLQMIFSCFLQTATYDHTDKENIVEARPSRERDINSFTPSDCRINFNFKKADLRRLVHLLRFPEYCILSKGDKMTGEEVFLRGMYELVSGDKNQEKNWALSLKQ